MAKPRLLYYTLLSYQPENVALMRDHFDVVELPDPRRDDDATLASLDACCAPLGFPFDARKMDRCPKLQAIVTNTTGVPHIDMDAAAARRIAVFSLKDEQRFLDTITPTAEHAIGLLLALTRRIPWSFDAVKGGRWNRFDFGAPTMLSRMSLGVIGYGRLGRKVARFGQTLGMQVAFHDPYQVGDGVAEKVDDLKALVARSDAVSLHVPAVPQTARMIDADVIAAFKPGSWFVNTARAELVDETALLQALQDGRIAGYAADVLDGEFDPAFKAARHPLVRYAQAHDNVLLTPHIGGSTYDAWRETQGRVLELAIRFFEGAR
jgi:D-3-phosphoglycerate dehydrogenase